MVGVLAALAMMEMYRFRVGGCRTTFALLYEGVCMAIIERNAAAREGYCVYLPR